MDIQVNDFLEAMKKQRNDALDEAALLRAQVAALTAKITTLEQATQELAAKAAKPAEAAPKRGRKSKTNGATHPDIPAEIPAAH